MTVGDRVAVYLRPEDVRILADGEASDLANVIEGEVARVIFEGSTAQLRVRVGARELRVDVGGGRRLSLGEGSQRVRLGFDELTVIPATVDGAMSGARAEEDPAAEPAGTAS